MGDIAETDSTQSVNSLGGNTKVNAGSYTGLDSTYQTLASWTITSGKTGILKEVAFTVDSTSLFQLDIDGTNLFTDFSPNADCSISFPNTQLSSGSIITLSVKSDGATTITVYGFISGGEV